MTWNKRQFQGFGISFYDPINEVQQSYIQSGVLSGPHYSASEVSYGLPKPSYLRSSQDSNVLTIKTDLNNPLVLVFALGLQSASDGNEGQWKNLARVITADADGDGSLTLSASSLIVAQLDEATSPYSVSYKALSPIPAVTFSRTAPSSPSDGDLWFDYDANWMKQWDAGGSQWVHKRWVILGEVGVGGDGYIYSMKSDFPHRGISDFVDGLYPHGENPWKHYDGVSFLTDGQYTAQRADQWVGDQTVVDNVAASQTAMNAVAASQTAMDAVAASQTAMNAVKSSNMAIGKFAASRAGLDPTGYADMDAVAASQTAMDVVIASQTAMDVVIASQAAMDAVLGSPNGAQSLFTINSGNFSSVEFNEGHIKISSREGYEATVTVSVDLSGVSTLNILWENVGVNNSNVYVSASNVLGRDGQFSKTTETIDVSGYSGTNDVTVKALSSSSSFSEIKLYNLWVS